MKIDGGCAKSAEREQFKAEACFSAGTLQLEYTDARNNYKIIMHVSKGGVEVDLPEDRPLTLEELVDFTKRGNLETLAAAQEVYQAREEMLLRRGNLLPNLNLGTLLSAAELPFGLIGEVGNLLPFLFPDNWIRVQASELTYDAERYAYKSLKANQVNILQGMYYTTLMDMAFMTTIKAHAEDLEKIQNSIDILARSGEVPESWRHIIQIKIVEDEEDILSTEQYLAQQLRSIQKLTGVAPTRNLISLKPIQTPEITEDIVIDLELEESLAITRSLEIKELIHLQRAASRLTVAAKWSWLNPNTDTRFNLGFGLEHAINVERANVAIIGLKQKEVENDIREAVINIEDSLSYIFRHYKVAAFGLKSSRFAFNSARIQFENGEIRLFELIELVEKVFRFEAKLSVIKYKYLTIQGNLDRLVVTGFYANDSE